MELDRYTVVLLRRVDPPPPTDEAAAATLQDQHLAFLASQHDAGPLLAAGPVRSPAGGDLAGICLYRAEPEEARAMAEEDPAVRGGVLRVETLSWFVPKGALTFGRGPFPRSMRDVAPP